MATYQRPAPQICGNSSFDDFSEALEDTTIHIPQVVKWSDSLTLCSFDKGSDHLYERICERWKRSTQNLDRWYSRLHLHFPEPFKPGDDIVETGSNNDFGQSYTFSSYWIAQALMHYWAARVLHYDALKQCSGNCFTRAIACLWLLGTHYQAH